MILILALEQVKANLQSRGIDRGGSLATFGICLCRFCGALTLVENVCCCLRHVYLEIFFQVSSLYRGALLLCEEAESLSLGPS